MNKKNNVYLKIIRFNIYFQIKSQYHKIKHVSTLDEFMLKKVQNKFPHGS